MAGPFLSIYLLSISIPLSLSLSLSLSPLVSLLRSRSCEVIMIIALLTVGYESFFFFDEF